MKLERIVSLEPSITAILEALNQRHRLVGVTRYCYRLVNVAGLPQLETTWSVKADEMAALAPDLVIAATPYQAGRVDELLKAGLNVLCLYPQSLADVYAHIIWLGRLCQVPGLAEQTAAWLGERFGIDSVAPVSGADIGFNQTETWIRGVCDRVDADPGPAIKAINAR
jgi:ABC-type hemin transport system substrate-binding protein